MRMLSLTFDAGTLVVRSDDGQPVELPGSFVFDPRIQAYRGPALEYRQLVSYLARHETYTYRDEARAYRKLELPLQDTRTPFPHQSEALAAWQETGGRGVVVLPTGSGKTFVAELAIRKVGRSCLVVTPTIDLMQQWWRGLTERFGRPVGMIGGGSYEVDDLCVTTYDSAYLHMEHLGSRFGMLVFDEAHHLPSPSYALAAESCVAPYRLGLTATPERADGDASLYEILIGPIVYNKPITELAGTHLADYSLFQLEVPLEADEAEAYVANRTLYTEFVRAQGIRMSSAGGWQAFLRESSRSPEGRAAYQGYLAQKDIALTCRGKLSRLQELLAEHRGERVIVFTNDNRTVYEISRRFLIPALTHHTPGKERAHILAAFNDGRYPALATSRVLNEGVDIPAASVGIVMSGTSSVREHVQRLGRILRQQGDKHARLYELVAADTHEKFISTRRREHDAYRR